MLLLRKMDGVNNKRNLTFNFSDTDRFERRRKVLQMNQD